MKRSHLPRNTTPMKRTAMLRRPPAATATVQPKDAICQQCDKPFRRARPMQNVCGWKCAQDKAEGKLTRKEKAALAEHRETIPKLIALAQSAFNAYIRARDRDKTCFVCERPFDQAIKGRALQAGHVRSRGAAGHLRFNEDNCHGECEGCNGPHGAKPHEIEAGAIRRIGQQRYDVLKNDNTPCKWLKDELRAIAATYRAKTRELKRGKT